MPLRDLLTDLRDDLRQALRSFRREPIVAAFVVATLALGIGANAAMFGVVDRLLLRGPEHITEPERVLRLFRTAIQPPQGELTTHSFGWITYDLLRRDTTTFAGVGAYMVYAEGTVFGEGVDARTIPFGAASWDLFPLLGVRPAHGRFFTPEEDSPEAPQPVVVLSHAMWQQEFGADPAVIGGSATFGSERFTIVGVAPHGFTGPQLAPAEAWMPMAYRSRNVTNDWPRSWNATWLRIVVRLRDGVTPEAAANAATLTHRAGYTGDDRVDAEARLFPAPLSSNARGQESQEGTVSRWLLGVTGVVLLIACANVANLLLARALRRRRDVAVRLALGASRGRLVRQLLTESLVLSFAGGGAGLVVAWGAAPVIREVLIPGLAWPASPVNAAVFAVAFALALVVGVVTGLAPALRATRADLGVALKAGARETGGQASRLRGALIVAQAALSLLLLVGAGLFVRSLDRIGRIDFGIEPDRMVVAQVRYAAGPGALGSGAAGERARRSQVLMDAMVRARTLPTVESSGLTIGLPFQSSFGLNVRVDGLDSLPRLAGGGTSVRAVSDGYFATAGTRIIEGRAFTLADRDGSEPVTIVSRTMAATLWSGRSPLGECVYWSDEEERPTTCSRIVGVAEDAHFFALREGPRMLYYIPFGQERGMGGTSLLVRPRSGTERETIASLRHLLVELDPAVTYVDAQLLQERVDPQARPWKLGATIFSLMGLLALIVAAVGLYGVLSYLVTQRRQEIGVRLALGARGRNIVALVLRSGLTLTLAGIVIGGVMALALARFVEPLLFDNPARDPAVLLGAAGLMLAVAVVASVVPAVRASRVDPMEVLRAE